MVSLAQRVRVVACGPNHTKGVGTMTIQEAQERASRLGLSVWIAQTVEVGKDSVENSELRCVGFVTADLAIAEAESWEEALEQATRIIFSA